jgi:hypothetical protein
MNSFTRTDRFGTAAMHHSRAHYVNDRSLESDTDVNIIGAFTLVDWESLLSHGRPDSSNCFKVDGSLHRFSSR